MFPKSKYVIIFSIFIALLITITSIGIYKNKKEAKAHALISQYKSEIENIDLDSSDLQTLKDTRNFVNSTLKEIKDNKKSMKVNGNYTRYNRLVAEYEEFLDDIDKAIAKKERELAKLEEEKAKQQEENQQKEQEETSKQENDQSVQNNTMNQSTASNSKSTSSTTSTDTQQTNNTSKNKQTTSNDDQKNNTQNQTKTESEPAYGTVSLKNPYDSYGKSYSWTHVTTNFRYNAENDEWLQDGGIFSEGQATQEELTKYNDKVKPTKKGYDGEVVTVEYWVYLGSGSQ